MTDLEKREALREFCHDQHFCEDCPISKGIPKHRCGCGTHFLSKKECSDKFDMTEEEINAAYAIAFPEPMMTELVEKEPDTMITISVSGKHKISNIEIYFKED